MQKFARLILACAGSLAVMSGSPWAKDLTFRYVPGSMIYPYKVATTKGFEAEAAGELSGSVGVKPEMLGRLMFKEMYAAATNADYKKGKFVAIDLPIITKDTLAGCPAEW
ncbi:hypothetical protein ACC676_00185 [Rhizobium ruizarguesonis]|nr:hypothetical protein [Rhizobium leguminosarum]MBY5856256.1 hypothetical protein [Rhizobium leguminosarum]